MAEHRDLQTRHFGGTDLVDLLDRIVDRGAVVTGDVVIGLAGIDLILLDLKLLLISVQGLDRERLAARPPAGGRARPDGVDGLIDDLNHLNDLVGPRGTGAAGEDPGKSAALPGGTGQDGLTHGGGQDGPPGGGEQDRPTHAGEQDDPFGDEGRRA